MEIRGKTVFVNVDTDYLKYLNKVDPEVQYDGKDYENKPFLGILISTNSTEYVIPLTSAKIKHINWKDSCSDGRFLVTEIIKKSEISPDTIYKDIDSDDHVKRIYAALDVKKMIPVDSSIYQVVDLSFDEDMDDAIKNYKILQNKEYRACVKIAERVIKKASAVYEKQRHTGKTQKFACSFAKLEKALLEYLLRNESSTSSHR